MSRQDCGIRGVEDRELHGEGTLPPPVLVLGVWSYFLINTGFDWALPPPATMIMKTGAVLELALSSQRLAPAECKVKNPSSAITSLRLDGIKHLRNTYSPMRALFVMTLLAVLVLPTGASAQVQTITATHTYILGDHDSKDDARQRCLLEAKRKVLEQAGVYIESASEVKGFDLTEDKITSFAAAVMHVTDAKEEVGFQQGHMSLTLTITAQVDLTEVRKLLAARQVDEGVRDDVAAQKERLKRLEAQFEAMQKQQQGGQAPGRTPAPPPSDLPAADVQRLHSWQPMTTRWHSSTSGCCMTGDRVCRRISCGRICGTASQWHIYQI